MPLATNWSNSDTIRAWVSSLPHMAQWMAPYSRGGVRKLPAASRTEGTVICCQGRCAPRTRGSRRGTRIRNVVFIRPLVVIRPTIRAERSGREAGRIIEVAAVGVIVPGIAHRNRRTDLRAADPDHIALDLRFSGHELPVCARNREPLQRSVLGHQAAAKVRELHTNRVARDLHRFV